MWFYIILWFEVETGQQFLDHEVNRIYPHLRSAEQGLLHVPFARTSAMQSRTFSVVGPVVWNGLPLALRSLPRLFSQKFLQQLKTTLFSRAAGVGGASE